MEPVGTLSATRQRQKIDKPNVWVLFREQRAHADVEETPMVHHLVGVFCVEYGILRMDARHEHDGRSAASPLFVPNVAQGGLNKNAVRLVDVKVMVRATLQQKRHRFAMPAASAVLT